jgi:hypothetical protein
VERYLKIFKAYKNFMICISITIKISTSRTEEKLRNIPSLFFYTKTSFYMNKESGVIMDFVIMGVAIADQPSKVR